MLSELCSEAQSPSYMTVPFLCTTKTRGQSPLWYSPRPLKVGKQIRCIGLLLFLSVFVFVMDYKPWWPHEGLWPWIPIGWAVLFHGGTSPAVMNSVNIMISVSLHCSASWESAEDEWLCYNHKFRHTQRWNFLRSFKSLWNVRLINMMIAFAIWQKY